PGRCVGRMHVGGGLAQPMNVPQKVARPRFVAALLVLLRQFDRVTPRLEGVIEPVASAYASARWACVSGTQTMLRLPPPKVPPSSSHGVASPRAPRRNKR